MEQGLIIFVRNPDHGKIKSRLAKDIGDEQSLKVYNYLLQYTRDIAIPLHCNFFVFYSSYIHLNDVFDDNKFSKHVQTGVSLGERMQNAFREIFDLGVKKACIIGTDCYELQTETLQAAFDALNQSDVVIGPATDGGYYLLGMKSLKTDLFTNKDWGTSTVLDDTISDLEAAEISYTELQVLNDIDTQEDLLKTDILTILEEEL